LLSDILVSSPQLPEVDPILPLKIYIPPGEFRQLQSKPTALRRKIVELADNLVVMWSGDYCKAVILCKRMRKWFRDRSVEKGALEEFFQAHYPNGPGALSAIVATIDGDWVGYIGHVECGGSKFCGEFAVAGTGKEIFKSMANRMPQRERTDVLADIDGLRFANDLLAQEIISGQPLRAAFGSGYEVIFRGQNGFERVDDVLHVFALVRVLGSRLEIEHYPYAIRQWYEGNQLFIGSFVTPEAALQGLGYHSFAIPSVLEEPRDTERSVDSLRERPKYMCMHHVFLTPGGWIPSTLTMRGDGIDEMFLIHQNGSEIKFEHTASYEERLRQQVSKLPN
jgi:hypothetical protein